MGRIMDIIERARFQNSTTRREIESPMSSKRVLAIILITFYRDYCQDLLGSLARARSTSVMLGEAVCASVCTY